MTIAEVLDLYTAHCAANGVHCAGSAADREYVFRLFREAYGNLKVSRCKAFHLSEFIAKHPRWKSSATKKSRANMIQAAFNWAAKQERIDRNPFRSVRYADAERRPEMPDATIEEVMTLGNKRFERAVHFLRLTGARLGELCQAVWQDVDLTAGVWTIPRHKGRRYTRKPKEVVLVAEAVALLQEIRARQSGDYTGIIFLNNRDRPWTRRTLGQQLARIKHRHGIKTAASLHGIRHMAASAMIGAGAPIKLVAEQLGHASVAITEKHYYHRSAEHLEAIRAAVSLGIRGVSRND